MRPIDISTFSAVEAATSFGPAPQLQWIKIADLVVDDSYQRPLESQTSRKSVRRIAEVFDWRRFAPVIVSPVPGGQYAIIDGQHRTTAAALRGIDQVPCNVVLADQAEQAIAFQAINGQVTQVSRHQIYKARIAGGDPKAMRIKTVTEAAGVQVLFSNRQSSMMEPHQTLALESITRAIDDYGDTVVRLALRSIVASANGKRGFLTAALIKSLSLILADNPQWREHPRLVAAVTAINLRREQDKAEIKAKEDGAPMLPILQRAIRRRLDQAMPHASAHLANAAD